MTSQFSAATATLGFDPADGGRLRLSFNGRELLVPAPALNLVIDGRPVFGWQNPKLTGGRGLDITGAVTGDVEATLSISQVADRDAFEFALTLRNTGKAPARISTADAFAGTLAAGTWQGLSFTSKWGDEFEPEHFGLDAPREIEIRTGRPDLAAALAPLANQQTWLCVAAERAVSRTMGGSCSMPLAAHAHFDGEYLQLAAAWGDPDQPGMLLRARSADVIADVEQAAALGENVAMRLRAQGAH